jgi:hypothetical protein
MINIFQGFFIVHFQSEGHMKLLKQTELIKVDRFVWQGAVP